MGAACDEHADESAVEAHAALVDGQNLRWVLKVIAVSVEEAVAQAAAHQDAHHHQGDDGQQVVEGDGLAPALSRKVNDQGRRQKARQIRKGIPANRERAERKRDGIEGLIEIVQHSLGYLPIPACSS